MINAPKPQKPVPGAIARKLARKSKSLAKHPAKPVNRALVLPACNTRAAARFAPVAGQGLAAGSSQTRPAPILPASYDAASHTVELVIATNQPVKVSGGYVEILSLEPGAADLSRVAAGIVPPTQH